MAKELVQFLKEVPLFSGFAAKELEPLLKTAKERSFEPGKPIVREGEQSNIGFYLVLDGQVEVKRGGRTLSTLGSGQFFGEMSVLDGAPRSADVIPTVKTTCLVLTNWDFRALVKSYPEIAMKVITELTRRLRQTEMALSE
ncbi:MAG: cyclic nucleotide-binding domain-containing protein [Candidatus Acetothermia bacterium]|nr:cyclic nucleotide-binding domain-containing protein [Candidatus Acetothermia bacterium]